MKQPVESRPYTFRQNKIGGSLDALLSVFSAPQLKRWAYMSRQFFVLTRFGFEVLAVAILPIWNCRAAPISLVGPSDSEWLLLFQLPIIGTLVLSTLMLFNWRTISSLILAVICSAIWIGIATASLKSIVGVYMLLSSGWIIFLIFLGIFLGSKNEAPTAGANVECKCGMNTPKGRPDCLWCGAKLEHLSSSSEAAPNQAVHTDAAR
jgi:hypothetical protein